MTKKIWKNYFDIVILPPKDVSDYARKISKELSRYGTEWVLGKNSFIPHISLYHIAVKPKDFTAFISEIKQAIAGFRVGRLQTTLIESDVLMVSKPEWIKKLYLKIIKNTLQYYDWDHSIGTRWHLDYFPGKRREIAAHFVKKYGTPMVGANFKPHVTLTSFKGKLPSLPIRKAKLFKFKPAHIYICELGPSHSCQRIVKELALSKN